MTNKEKLFAWVKNQVENHGLIDMNIFVWSSYNNYFFDSLERKELLTNRDTLTWLEDATPTWDDLTEEERAGEIMKMIEAPVLEDKDIF